MPTIKTGIRFSKKQPLSEQELRQLHAYWRAANYLTACQLYLMDNPSWSARWSKATSSRPSWDTGGPAPARTSSIPIWIGSSSAMIWI